MTVFAAIYESGNGTTLLGGGADAETVSIFPPNVVSDRQGPYRGKNPPPNAGDDFDPPLNPELSPAPPVGMIVRQSGDGRWLDDNNGDWTELVSGENADASGRPIGWELIDNDVAANNPRTVNRKLS
ncbi:MAG: hypothetical protein ACI9R3_006575 [Verrucomicrobiales bacterium]|jgi:hypothetical protein